MKNAKIILSVVALMLVMSPMVTLAAEGGYQSIVRSWVQERDQTVRTVVYGWLRGASASSLQEQLIRIIELDVKLANENVPLYVTSFKEGSDLKSCLGDLVSTYLKRRGVMSDTKAFFEGRSYQMIHSRIAAR